MWRGRHEGNTWHTDLLGSSEGLTPKVRCVQIWVFQVPIHCSFQFFFFFFKDFIYLFMIDTHRERGRDRQREKQASCREPNAGLDPRSPESRPGLQATPNSCATGAAQISGILLNYRKNIWLLRGHNWYLVLVMESVFLIFFVMMNIFL